MPVKVRLSNNEFVKTLALRAALQQTKGVSSDFSP
jgi:hypothetical protein